MHRFYVEDIARDKAVITGEDARHISRVLRLRLGDVVLACDGAGREWDGKITALSDQRVSLSLSGQRPAKGEPRVSVTLYQCLPKQGKMELIVQKCVELGVTTIVPTTSARCVTRLEGKDVDKRVARYQRVAYEAAKQCGRGVVPRVTPPVPLSATDPAAHGLMLLAYELAETPLKGVLSAHKDVFDVGLIIGPEGGLEEREAHALTAAGAVPVSLGGRILRTETAGMAALAMILYELEG